jgi:hypothetical protein
MTTKYVALDLYQASSGFSVRDHRGKVGLGNVVPTSANAIIEILDSIDGTAHVAIRSASTLFRARSATGIVCCGRLMMPRTIAFASRTN